MSEQLDKANENLENEQQGAASKRDKLFKELYEWLECGVMALILVVLIFTFIGRTSFVSGSSMTNTLVDGDMLFVSRWGFNAEPGDIVVATKPYSHNEPIIKRIIATGGQTVDINFEEGIVFVNGEMIDEDYVRTPTNRNYGMEFPLTVPEGYVFLLGDNRNGSYDSRASEIGLVDERYVMGKAYFRVYPFSSFKPLY